MVSIIVPLFNHCSDLTVPFVERVLQCKGKFELILVDNASSDDTREYLKSLRDRRIVKVYSDVNTGFGGGNNLGFQKATGDSVCFISNDVLMNNPKWIELFEKEGEEHPDCLMGPMLVTENTLTDFRFRQTPYINGFCVFAKTKLFKSILHEDMVWDEDFGLAYFEDVDLSVRAVLAGYKLREIKDSGLHHMISQSSDKMNINEQFTFNQKVFRSKMYRYEKKEKLRIVFYCSSNYEFTDADYEGKGVGGAEGSMILFARELAKMGHVVDIYNSTPVEEKSNGVWYHNLSQYDFDDYCDIFILFRTPYRLIDRVNSPLKIFWSCDQYTSRDWNESIVPFVDKTIAISSYHKEYLLSHYSFEEDDVLVLDLGINAVDYKRPVPKNRYKMIFCSVPMRGLKYMRELFLEIQRQVPPAELVITSDYRLWGVDDPRNHEFRAMFSGIPGVKFLGKISRQELVEEQMNSRVMAYPCEYDENFCIAAMECMAAGTVPVTTAIGAIPTTVGEEGIVLQGTPEQQTYKDQFISWVVRLLNRDAEWNPLSQKAKHRALSFYSWEYLTREVWLPVLLKLHATKMKKFNPNQCPMCGEKLPNAFEFFKHKKTKHEVLLSQVEGTDAVSPKVSVKIITREPVEVSINNFSWIGKELIIPYEYASEVIRILTNPNGYWGKDIIESQSILE